MNKLLDFKNKTSTECQVSDKILTQSLASNKLCMLQEHIWQTAYNQVFCIQQITVGIYFHTHNQINSGKSVLEEGLMCSVFGRMCIITFFTFSK
jgi:hypothetical protein